MTQVDYRVELWPKHSRLFVGARTGVFGRQVSTLSPELELPD